MAGFSIFNKSDDFTQALDQFKTTIDAIPSSSKGEYIDSDADTVKTVMSVASNGDNPDLDIDEMSQLFQDLEIPKNKIQRYHLYDSIYNNVQIAKRVITVYLNNTFLRNAVSNKHYAIHMKPKVDDTEGAVAKQFALEFIHSQDLMGLLKRATRDCLIYGDGYLEFIDLEDVQVTFPDGSPSSPKGKVTSINEDSIYTRLIAESQTNNIEPSRSDLDTICDHLLDFNNDLPEYNQPQEETVVEGDNPRTKDEESNVNVQNRFIVRYHDPAKITELVSEYGMTLGYVQISVESKNTSNSSNNVVQQFMNSVELQGGFKPQSTRKKGITIKSSEFTDVLVRKIIDKLGVSRGKVTRGTTAKEVETKYNEEILSKLTPDVLWAVKKMLVNAGKSSISSPSIKVRYIQSANISQIRYTSGTSVIDTLVYPSKIYLLMQLTNLLSRLSKAATIRKWTLDIGSREDASAIVRQLKTELRNQRITASDMATKDVSKLITDFKDLITVSKNGKSYVDVSVENLGDISNSTADLEFQRNEIVAVSGIPGSYLGYTDSYELRDQLVHANISFANEIMGVQSETNNAMMVLIDRAAVAAGHKPVSQYLTVALTPPMVLMLQVMETVMSSFSTIYSTVSDTMGLPLDPVSMLEQFVPYADWKTIIDQGKLYKQAKSVSPPADTGGGF